MNSLSKLMNSLSELISSRNKPECPPKLDEPLSKLDMPLVEAGEVQVETGEAQVEAQVEAGEVQIVGYALQVEADVVQVEECALQVEENEVKVEEERYPRLRKMGSPSDLTDIQDYNLDQHMLWLQSDGEHGARFIGRGETLKVDYDGGLFFHDVIDSVGKVGGFTFCFEGADLAGAVFTATQRGGGLRLSHANFKGANLENANFKGRYLVHGGTSGFEFQGTNFTKSNLKGAGLSDSVFSTDVKFDGADLEGADLSNTSMIGASFNGAVFKNTKLDGAFIGDENDFYGAVMDGLDFRKVRLGHLYSGCRASLEGASLRGARFDGQDLKGECVSFKNCDLTNANFSNSYMRNKVTTGEAFEIEGATLDSTNFAGASLEGIDFSKAKLVKNINFSLANLSSPIVGEDMFSPESGNIWPNDITSMGCRVVLNDGTKLSRMESAGWIDKQKKQYPDMFRSSTCIENKMPFLAAAIGALKGDTDKDDSEQLEGSQKLIEYKGDNDLGL